MSEWKAKRFWKSATVAEADGGQGFTVHLDGRPVRTPAKAPLVVPTRALAEAIAAEWDAQEEQIDPTTMPFTRAANAAIDKVGPQHDEVADMIAAYGDSDLTCYRADSPAELVARQAEAWDPLLEWAARELGVQLEPVQGVMHSPQDPDSLAELRRLVHAMDPFELTAFHDLVSLSGSLVIGFAARAGARTPEALWEVSRIDECWQEKQWGVDEEARAHSLLKRNAFLQAKRFADFSREFS